MHGAISSQSHAEKEYLKDTERPEEKEKQNYLINAFFRLTKQVRGLLQCMLSLVEF